MNTSEPPNAADQRTQRHFWTPTGLASRTPTRSADRAPGITGGMIWVVTVTTTGRAPWRSATANGDSQRVRVHSNTNTGNSA
jgi:hypothetical protein